MSTSEVNIGNKRDSSAAAAAPGRREEEEDEKDGRVVAKKKLRKDGTVAELSTKSDKAKASVIEKAQREVFEKQLGLEEIHTKETLGKVRPRTHLNPLTVRDATQPPENWGEIFADPSLPLFVDIGCAAGRFGLLAAKHEKWRECNHLGLEIRPGLSDRANLWVKSLNLTNAHYICCNANNSLEGFLRSYPGKTRILAIQFPDPHFKKKHHKRRVVTEEFMNMVSSILAPGAQVFLQSDVEEAASQMRDRFTMSPYFRRAGGEYTPRDPLLDVAKNAANNTEDCWSPDGKRIKFSSEQSLMEPALRPKDFGDFLASTENPIGVPTEREVQNSALGLPIYRSLFDFIGNKSNNNDARVAEGT